MDEEQIDAIEQMLADRCGPEPESLEELEAPVIRHLIEMSPEVLKLERKRLELQERHLDIQERAMATAVQLMEQLATAPVRRRRHLLAPATAAYEETATRSASMMAPEAQSYQHTEGYCIASRSNRLTGRDHPKPTRYEQEISALSAEYTAYCQMFGG